MEENNVRMSIIFNVIDEENEEAECSVQFNNFQIVPRVGERFVYYTVRDHNGNYLNKNILDRNSIKIIDGIVEKVEYEVDQRGWHSGDVNTLGKLEHVYFVTIFVRGDPINDPRY